MVRIFLNKSLIDVNTKKFAKQFAEFAKTWLRTEKCCTIVQNILKEGLETLLDFFKIVIENITSEEFKKQVLKHKCDKIRNVLMIACVSANIFMLETFWIFLKTILNTDEQNNLLTETAKDDVNVLHLASNYSGKNIIEYLFSIIKEQFQLDEQRKLFQKLDCFGQNIFYFAVNNSKNEEIFTTLWNCIKSVLTNGEIENLLARTSSSNVFNVLHSLIIKNEKKPLEDFFKMLQNNFGTDFQK